MKSSIAGRVLSVLSAFAMSISLVTTAVTIHISVARAQDKPSVTQAKAKVDLTTDPSPAQKGSNTIRVKLTDPAGKPITGAQVTATFFMPAMPTMNMPEMKTVIKGEDKGSGIYEGKGDLGSGGMWQVTVTAQQDGKTIVTKKLTVKAEGGM
jgi:Cu(I)/Ag(I) efflux system membrane fusion protein/cobalt-zinc-cadmium efflux system membrane fusion protein